MNVTPPYLMFLGDVPDALAAKTAQGVVDWRRDWCLAQLRLPGCGAMSCVTPRCSPGTSTRKADMAWGMLR